MSDPREARLPKWAQDQLRSLRMHLESANRRIAELNGEPGNTNTFVSDYIHGDSALPNGAKVMFRLDSGYNGQVMCYLEDDALTIQGHDGINVIPQASNSIRIERRKRW